MPRPTALYYVRSGWRCFFIANVSRFPEQHSLRTRPSTFRSAWLRWQVGSIVQHWGGGLKGMATILVA
jgi:hypothetical protein